MDVEKTDKLFDEMQGLNEAEAKNLLARLFGAIESKEEYHPLFEVIENKLKED